MKILSLYLYLSFFLFHSLIYGQQAPIIINKDKQYPKKNLKLEDIANVSYIPLETTPDVLLDKDAHLCYVSDKRMLVFNPNHGDIFIFGIDGKALLHFNHRGPDSYTHIGSVAYDEKNKEIFILDFFSKRIFVFTEDGVYRRIVHTPDNVNPNEIYNFDDQNILVFDDRQFVNSTPVVHFPLTHPFVLLSKKDGAIISKINVTMDKRLAKRITIQTGPNNAKTYSTLYTCANNKKFGQDFILADFSLDTIYHLKKDKTLMPIFVQSPTVFSDHPRVTSVGMFTDRFITFCVYTWDILEQKRNIDKNQKVQFNARRLMYDFEEKKIFEINLDLGAYRQLDSGKNMCAELFEASGLIEALNAGRLKGEIKRVAKRLNDEDNQVVQLIKFK